MANTPISPKQKAQALDAIGRGMSDTAAAVEAGFDRHNFRTWRESDPDFAAAYEQARGQGNDAIRDEIRRRAVEGETETWTDKQGNEHTTVKRSDLLLIFLAKSRMPEFRDNLKVDQTINGRVQVDHSALIAASLNGGFSRTNRISGALQEGQN